ncbi:MAG: LTA synthase family protein, partial [Actinobacteria bacterium]|nr:LTA synthase family protein [Actinomycetota bacterium]
MGTKQGRAGVVVRLKRLLIREDWIYLLSLLVPVGVYNVALKVWRVATQFEVPGPLGFLDQVRSDLLFNLGYAVLWIGIFAVVRGRVPRLLALGLFHVFSILVIVLTTCAHVFFLKTGSTLGLSFVLNSLSSVGEIWGAITSETKLMHWIVIPIAVLYGSVGPAIVTRLVTHRWHVPPRNVGRSRAALLATYLAALSLFSLSLLPSVTGAGNAFSRDVVANMIVSEIATPEVEVRLAAGSLPTDTEFVGTPQTNRRNVVIVFLESTRAQSTTPYNEDLDTTPFLDELSKDSLMFERAYAVVPHTSKALVVSLCGVPPPLDTAKTESEPGIIPARCVPHLLKEHGYRTVFFQSATEKFERRPQLVDNMGYEDFFATQHATQDMSKEGFEETNYFGYEDNIMLDPSREWLEENGDEPFLATYLTATGHHQYVVPHRYGKKKFVEDEAFNRYLNTMRYQDFFLMNLFAQYKDLGLYEDTIFIVLGDHGEGFDEHGLKQHDNTIYEEGLRIPFVIHQAGRWEGGEWIEPAVSELDILPTVADLLGYRIEGDTYPGASMLDPPEHRTLRASCYHVRTCLASIEDGEKYIYHYGNKADEYFDLSEDPR